MFVSNGRKKGVGKRRSLCAFQLPRCVRRWRAWATQAHGTAHSSAAALESGVRGNKVLLWKWRKWKKGSHETWKCLFPDPAAEQVPTKGERLEAV